MTNTRQSPFSFSEDARVIDSSGKEVGTVKEVRDGYFKVNVSMAPDYWLPFHTISGTEGGEVVHLNLAGDELEKARIMSGIESLGPTDIDESLDDSSQSIPVERRYENEADYLTRAHRI